MEIPIQKPETMTPGKWEFVSLDSVDPAHLARCYVDVFGSRQMDWNDALRKILATRGFDIELSFAALDPATREVVGFCLLQRTGPQEVYIMAVGVTRPVRGKNVTTEGSAYLHHTLDAAGIKRAVFVTSFQKLAQHFADNLHARKIDRMLWYSLCK